VTRRQAEAVAVDELYALRWEVLRKDTPCDEIDLPGDRDPTTVHLAVRGDGGEIVAAATWLERESPDRPGRRALQLRAMAVAATHRRQGLGARLIEGGVRLAAERDVDIVWANARDSALDFYTSQGFIAVGEGFITADTRLPHHRIVRDL